ncbi:MAG: cyclic lactone autoinducer peptide [Clostridiales bacterium]|nr:cyclic lactone autoinducer peptide [Clostridiales bacterium]
MKSASKTKLSETGKKLVLKFGPALASMAMAFLIFDVNTACVHVAYQPELPKNCEKFKRP